MYKPVFCSDLQSDDDGEMPRFSLALDISPGTIFSQQISFASFLVPIAAFPVALLSSLNVTILTSCSLGYSPSAPSCH